MKAYELISSKSKWNRGGLAAHSMCAAQAIDRAYNNNREHLRALDKLRKHTKCLHVTQWNDDNTWETVYSTLKKLDI